MVYLTNTLDTHNLTEHCSGIVNKHPGYTESQGHCNGIVNKHPGYTESQGALQWYSLQTPWIHRISRITAMV